MAIISETKWECGLKPQHIFLLEINASQMSLGPEKWAELLDVGDIGC